MASPLSWHCCKSGPVSSGIVVSLLFFVDVRKMRRCLRCIVASRVIGRLVVSNVSTSEVRGPLTLQSAPSSFRMGWPASGGSHRLRSADGGLPSPLYYTVLYCIVLYYTVLYCIALYRAVLHCILMYGIVLYGTAMYCVILYCIVLCCSVL